ncbi:tRNA (adenosine(37)-N6)-threonylcarbamoyltransferase complex transferase subunit TsaD [Blattabacterium cuenoti]|uniref:tRNA (adenosine(37)-N6)-threonylcarbamoyltransferase complex transferase subunit TsaD n=1 Tax=Blattabacterium cuenoti TaxID=1653831 RepID=UPI00163D2160|nr:tRNA (adenosine(37)-N6)-threonylcarbamoyltransferase complex transferase subunit TsaD [Blattabacterium cuenoti]
MQKELIIIGIESSCDDTAVSIIKGRKVLSNIIFHQNIHKKYGGVVPELASRLHEKKLPLATKKAIFLSKIDQNQIDGVSVTFGPGLIGPLLVGSSFAKSFSMGLGVPLLSANHIQSHIFTHFIENANINNNSYPKFPFLSLVISGGHTLIIEVNHFFHMKILGSTLDDSVGNVFDQIARILGIHYPGGPMIDFFSKYGNKNKFHFSKPLVNGLNFSFSGLKSQIRKFIENNIKNDPFFIKKHIHDICASMQKIISEILLEKVYQAILQTNIFRVSLSGGVSANHEIQNTFLSFFKKKTKKWELFLPKIEYATDNAAMIGISGIFKYERKMFESLDTSPFSKLKKF